MVKEGFYFLSRIQVNYFETFLIFFCNNAVVFPLFCLLWNYINNGFYMRFYLSNNQL